MSALTIAVSGDGSTKAAHDTAQLVRVSTGQNVRACRCVVLMVTLPGIHLYRETHMTTVTEVADSVSNALWEHGLVVDSDSLERTSLRIYLAEQARIIAAHAKCARWSNWLLGKTYLLAAGAMPCSVFYFHMMAVACAAPLLEERVLHDIVTAVRTLRNEMYHSPREVAELIQAGFSYHEKHPCTLQAAYEDRSYVKHYAHSLACNWY